MGVIHHSVKESEFYGLKIGRIDRVDDFNATELADEIYSGQYDLVKMKLSFRNKELFVKLGELPFFTEHYNYITLQRRQLKIDEELSVDSSLRFELYDGSQKSELRSTLEKILSENEDNVYYNSALLSCVISNGHLLKNSLDYYLEINHTVDSNLFMFLGKYGEQTVGVCSFRKTANGEAEGVIYGVIPEFRNQNLAISFLHHSLKTLAKNGVTFFNTEVLYSNAKSLYPHIHAGFKPAGLYLNLNIFPLLDKKIASFSVSSDNWTGGIVSWMADFYKTHFQVESVLCGISSLKGHIAKLEVNAQIDFVLCLMSPKYFLLRSEDVYIMGTFTAVDGGLL